jgi:hypothetical protein
MPNLTQQQISELDIASARVAAGQGQSQDQANIDYAMENFGYSFNPQDTELQGAVAPETPEIDVTQGDQQLIQSAGQSNRDAYFDQIAGSALTEMEKQILEYRKQMEGFKSDELIASEKAQENAALGLEQAMDRESGLDLFKRFRQEAGIKEKEDALNDIMSQINSVKDSFQQGKTALIGESSTMKLLRGKQAILADQANAQISSLAAAGQLVQGKLNSAQKLVENYYKIAMQDRDDEIARRKILFDMADKKLISLTEEENEMNSDAISLLESINSRQLEEKDAVTSLMLRYPLAWQNAAGQLDLTKPFNEIAKQMLPFIAAEEQAKRRGSGTDTGLPSGIRTKFATEEEEAIYNFAYNLVQAEQAGAITPDQWSSYINNVKEETKMTYEQAENQVIANMQEIQGVLDLTGKPNYGAGSGSDLGGDDVDFTSPEGIGSSIRGSFDPFAFPKKAYQLGKGIGEFGAGLFGFDVLDNKK